MHDIWQRFGWSSLRRRLCRGLADATENLARAGIRRVWIDGSFTTSRDRPNDVDGCWEYNAEVDLAQLDSVFLDTAPPRRAMKDKYGVDFLIAGTRLGDPSAGGATVQDFFQVDRDGNAKGILLVRLGADHDSE